MAMAMAMARSVFGRVARGRHPASQPLPQGRAALELSLPSAGWRLQRHPAADHMGKRYLSDGKGQWFYSALDKMPDIREYVSMSSIVALCAFTWGMSTIVPYTIDNTRRAKLDEGMRVDKEAGPKKSP